MSRSSTLVVDTTGNELTYRIIGAAMAVHNELGPGLKEEVYEQALVIELQRRDIAALRQHPVDVFHEGTAVALFYLDLFVEQSVVVEIKALAHQLTNDERAQLINYLGVARAPVGLLINFGRRRLEFQRVFPAVRDSFISRLGRDNLKRRDRAR